MSWSNCQDVQIARENPRVSSMRGIFSVSHWSVVVSSILEESLAIAEWRKVTRGGLFIQSLAGEDFLGNNTSNGHHSGTAIVKFSVLLANFLGRFFLPIVDLSEPDAVVTIKLGGRPPGKLDKAANKKDLGESGSGDLEESTDSGADVRELNVFRWGKVPIESPLVVVDEGAKHGHHSNTSMLTLDSTVAGEFLVISDVSKGIKETKGGGGTNLLL